MKTYKMTKENGKEYILAAQASPYAEERLKTSFNIPAPRSLRLYVKEGIIERPMRRGKEAYFEVEYIIGAISILRELKKWGLALNTMKRIVLNVRKHNRFNDAIELLEAAGDSYIIKEYPRYLFETLSIENPSTIKLSKIEEDTMKLTKKENADRWKKIDW